MQIGLLSAPRPASILRLNEFPANGVSPIFSPSCGDVGIIDLAIRPIGQCPQPILNRFWQPLHLINLIPNGTPSKWKTCLSAPHEQKRQLRCRTQKLVRASGFALDEGGFGGEAEHFEEARLDAVGGVVDFVHAEIGLADAIT